MPIGILFWVLMVLWAIGWVFGRSAANEPYWNTYNGWLLWVLFAMLGWGVFGPIVR